MFAINCKQHKNGLLHTRHNQNFADNEKKITADSATSGGAWFFCYHAYPFTGGVKARAEDGKDRHRSHGTRRYEN